jgi:hypothetical protein
MSAAVCNILSAYHLFADTRLADYRLTEKASEKEAREEMGRHFWHFNN